MQESDRVLSPPPSSPAWEPPSYRLIPLDCEITAYAPDEDPLY